MLEDYLDPALDAYICEDSYRQTRAPVNMATTLLPDAYRKETYFQLEQDRVYGSSWVAAGYLEEVDSTGKFIVRDIAGQSIDFTGKR